MNNPQSIYMNRAVYLLIKLVLDVVTNISIGCSCPRKRHLSEEICRDMEPEHASIVFPHLLLLRHHSTGSSASSLLCSFKQRLSDLVSKCPESGSPRAIVVP